MIFYEKKIKVDNMKEIIVEMIMKELCGNLSDFIELLEKSVVL